jgi:hypothetical protein
VVAEKACVVADERAKAVVKLAKMAKMANISGTG